MVISKMQRYHGGTHCQSNGCRKISQARLSYWRRTSRRSNNTVSRDISERRGRLSRLGLYFYIHFLGPHRRENPRRMAKQETCKVCIPGGSTREAEETAR